MNTAYQAGLEAAFTKFANRRHLAKLAPEMMKRVTDLAEPVPSFGARDPTVSALKTMRYALRNPRSFEVPLPSRLQSYKYWKQTGKVPTLSSSGISPGFADKAWSDSDEPVRLITGGRELQLLRSLRWPSSRMQNRYVIPGQTQAALRGHQAYVLQESPHSLPREPAVAGAQRYSRPVTYVADPADTPAALAFDVPRKQMLGAPTGEVAVPHWAATTRPRIVEMSEYGPSPARDRNTNFFARLNAEDRNRRWCNQVEPGFE